MSTTMETEKSTAEQPGIPITPNRISIGQIKAMHDAGKITIPPYQRGAVWTTSMKRAFVCAILDRESAIPNIAVHQQGDTWHVVDGQQRIRTILEYVNGRMTLPKSLLAKYGLAESYTGKFAGLGEETKQGFLDFTLDYKTTDTPRKTFLRLQNAKPLNTAEKNHALECELNECLHGLADEYNRLFNLCAFDNRRFKAEEVLAACLYMALHGTPARNPKDILKLYDSFEDNEKCNDALGRAKDVLTSMAENVRDKQSFLGAANFRAVFLLLLEADQEGLLESYEPHLNEFLKQCSGKDHLSPRNRMGEENAQKDALKREFRGFVDAIVD